MLLHAPDEYVTLPGREERGALLDLLGMVESNIRPGKPAHTLSVPLLDFARSQQAPDGSPPRLRGEVIDSSYARADSHNTYVPIVDPASIVCSGPHAVFAEAGQVMEGDQWEMQAKHVAVHHYVELLERDRGRCLRYHSTCGTTDINLKWAVKMLREHTTTHARNATADGDFGGVENPSAKPQANNASVVGQVGDAHEEVDNPTYRDCFISEEHFQHGCCDAVDAYMHGTEHFQGCCGHLLQHCHIGSASEGLEGAFQGSRATAGG